MQSRVLVLGMCLIAGGTRSAFAQSCPGGSCTNGDFASRQDGDFDDYLTWCHCEGNVWVIAGSEDIPVTSGDTVYVLEDTTVSVDSASQACGNLVLESASSGGNDPAVLAIESNGGDLTVHGTLGMGTPSGGGGPSRIEFTGTSGAAGVLTFVLDGTVELDRELVVKGKGKVEIDAATDFFVKNNGVIKGESNDLYALEINGAIENDADIDVSANFDVTFTGAGLTTGSSGTLKIDHASAVVTFNNSASVTVTDTTAEVLLWNGKLDFDSPLQFQGYFEMKPTGTLDTQGLETGERAKFCDGNC